MKLQQNDYIYVGIQGIVFIAYFFEIHVIALDFVPNYIRFIAFTVLIFGFLCVLMALLQLNTHISPFPTPTSNAVLVENGVFRFVRHPIYAGILYAAFGYAIYMVSLYKISIAMLLLLLFYKKSIYEEYKLQRKFPDYTLYQKRTGRFFPKFSKAFL